MRCKTLQAEIQHRGYQYMCMKRGRGPTHEAAFAAGAKLILDLVKSGELSIEQIEKS